jgi:light-regulated signal transduction histidine kinase (bacteriophytochrome)
LALKYKFNNNNRNESSEKNQEHVGISGLWGLVTSHNQSHSSVSLELQEILTATVTEVRSFLQTDRVKVYRFHPDESGQVVAESITLNRLPSLLGLNFPAGDIPPKRVRCLSRRISGLLSM